MLGPPHATKKDGLYACKIAPLCGEVAGKGAGGHGPGDCERFEEPEFGLERRHMGEICGGMDSIPALEAKLASTFRPAN